MRILVLNAGSTSLKFGLFASAQREPVISGAIDWASGRRCEAVLAYKEADFPPERCTMKVVDEQSAAEIALQTVTRRSQVDAVGHRVVYGGAGMSQRVTEEVKARILAGSELAPLHNPPALAAILATDKLLPGIPQVAVFDTDFFAALPPRAFLYALPYSWYERWGVRRIGFHGISNAYCVIRAAEMLRHASPRGRQVTCHLGGGCSVSAILDGKPRETTMGFTPLEGLPMGTRCGSVDPGLLIHLQRRCGLNLEELEHGLTCESGLLGISGVSSDLAEIEAAAQKGNARAKLAFEIFADRVRSAIGSMAAGLGGLDTLVFTDRIGAGSSALRAEVCRGLECVGVKLDSDLNARCEPDADISVAGSNVRVLVLHTREEWMIAEETLRALKAAREK